MACGVEEIVMTTLSIEKKVDDMSKKLQTENEKIAQTMKEVQSVFGDQQTGQRLVQLLNDILHKILLADNALMSARAKLKGFALNVQK